MFSNIPEELYLLLLCVIGGLAFADLGSRLLVQFAREKMSEGTIANLKARIHAWWILVLVFFFCMFAGKILTTLMFAFASFCALREFITITPSKRADHQALFWAFFVALPMQYVLVYIDWYGFFCVFIPVYVFVFIPVRIVLEGDTEKFLDRSARIQWGLMVCVYFVSHIPALLTLPIPGFEGRNSLLLFFLITVTQLSDVFQYVWGKPFGKRKVAPTVSPSKTWEGLIGGSLSASLVGLALYWITPFSPLQAFVFALLIVLMGFFGGLTMSAIKRSRGVKDFGGMIGGHGGMLDRIDSLCFSAPIFFHVVRYYFTV
jgi:phosphatidate cytidylyltransferase